MFSSIFITSFLGVSKKLKNRKKITEKTDRFSFGFISLKQKKPNRTQTKKNPIQTEKNRAKLKKPVFVLK
jgi:hypothetical protein